MTNDQARIVLLEAELDQAIYTIEFLHCCLKSKGYSYEYPEQTPARVASARELVPERPQCMHSCHDHECESCVFHAEERGRQAEARAVLDATSSTETVLTAIENERTESMLFYVVGSDGIRRPVHANNAQDARAVSIAQGVTPVQVIVEPRQ